MHSAAGFDSVNVYLAQVQVAINKSFEGQLPEEIIQTRADLLALGFTREAAAKSIEAMLGERKKYQAQLPKAHILRRERHDRA